MQVLKSKLTLTLMLVGTFALLSGSVFGQQPPSQRYQPVRDNGTPPSVHVAPQDMQPLPARFRGDQPPVNRSTSFTFTDQTGTSPVNPRAMDATQTAARAGNQGQAMPGTIQQTSFQVDENGAPVVPEILTGPPMTNSTPGSMFQPPAESTDRSASDQPKRKTPDDFAAAMKQAAGQTAPISLNQAPGQSQDINAEMADLHQRVKSRANGQDNSTVSLESNTSTGSRVSTNSPTSNQQPAAVANHLNVPTNGTEIATQRQQAEEAAAARVAAENAAADRIALQPPAATDKVDSAKSWIGEISSEQKTDTATQPTASPNAPKLVAKQVGEVPAVMQLAKNNFVSQPVQKDTQVRPASIEEKSDTSIPTIQLGAPAIEVETFGPQTVGINKAAKYQVVVNNASTKIAERILVGINLPEWIDIENVNLTTGAKEITDGKNQARLVWSIDKIPGNSSQTITITTVPRKAEAFDVGVEWTLVPRIGKTTIEVTEPRLEMSIAGPEDVLYGEVAVYHVTVRNPGTGDAENVTVMLPEALGGEEAPLGTIEAGKERVFEVQLTARTAGELNLVTTAAAEGNLQTTAERALIVRRANLEIDMQGPGLKYSGSIAQYQVTVANTGDAIAHDIVSAVALPAGVKYISGVEAVNLIEGGMRWPVGTLDPGQKRVYKINCQLDTSGELQLEVGARGNRDLSASSACLTKVETVADLVLTVADPKGPLPTGEAIPYEIKVQNRGSRSAKGVNLVMQFSEGIEPKSADGIDFEIVPGQVMFSPITQIDPGQEMTFKVTAEAMNAGTHIFRAQLVCEDSDSREIAEGTTRFFGETIQPGSSNADSKPAQLEVGANDFNNGFKR